VLDHARSQEGGGNGTIVAAAPTEPGSRAVLMAIAAYVRQTGAFVIAEGIEDDETLAFLDAIDERELHGDAVIRGGQDYGLGRPEATIRDIPLGPLRDITAAAEPRGRDRRRMPDRSVTAEQPGASQREFPLPARRSGCDRTMMVS
jgi:EAL domain-containing protein (putative c-di-GMP-specific phosphodiesterase class I)